MRCPDGSCVNGTLANCPVIGSCNVGVRCADGICRGSLDECLPVDGCPSSAPYYCAGLKSPCVASREVCLAGPPLPAGRRLLETVSGSNSQQACVSDCERDVPATPQAVAIPRYSDLTIDVSVDLDGSPRTQMLIPASAIPDASVISIAPVPSAYLDRSPAFSYNSQVLSSPFTCAVDSPNSFASPVVVSGAIDIKSYSGGAVSVATVPCEVQSSPVSFGVTSADFGSTCSGAISFSSTGMSWSMNSACEIINIAGSYTGQGFAPQLVSSQDGTRVETCNCFNVSSSIPNANAPGVLFGPGQGAQLRYPVGSVVCLYVRRLNGVYTMNVYTNSTFASSLCPSGGPGSESWALSYALSTPSGFTDACGGVPTAARATAIQGQIDPKDICLGTINSATNQWQCVEPDYYSRINNPVWKSDFASPRTRVQGLISSCTALGATASVAASGSASASASPSGGSVTVDASSSAALTAVVGTQAVYAFVNIPLPPPPQPPTVSCDIWCQNKWLIIGLIIGFGVFIVVSSYVIYRLCRYRQKYKEKQRELNQLQERARNLDEYAGGLGMMDEEGEVVMVANPLVLQMQDLQKQIETVNTQMNTTGQTQKREITQLESERERLKAEIDKIKALLASQSQKTATRVDDMPSSQNIMLTTLSPAPVPEFSSFQPQPIAPYSSSAAPAAADPFAAPAPRSDFGAAPRAQKKKDF